MQAVGWDQAARHVETPTHVTLSEARDVAADVWHEIASECNMRKDVTISVDMDVDQDRVLAYTRRTLVLQDNTWKPSVMFDYNGLDIEVHLNPNVPNGWHVGEGCHTGWRYDLRTVLRHELLHGAGLSCSIRPDKNAFKVGYNTMQGDHCYPTFYDTRLLSGGVPVVEGCHYHADHGDVHMAGRHIYIPSKYRAGSSYSHHAESGLFQWQLGPTTCAKLGVAEFDMLNDMGYDCTVGYSLSDAQNTNPTLWVILLLLFLCSASI